MKTGSRPWTSAAASSGGRRYIRGCSVRVSAPFSCGRSPSVQPLTVTTDRVRPHLLPVRSDQAATAVHGFHRGYLNTPDGTELRPLMPRSRVADNALDASTKPAWGSNTASFIASRRN